MSIRSLRARLARLEAQVKPLACPVCNDGYPITIHNEWVGPDGEVTLDPPLPPPCPRCGGQGAKGPISFIIFRIPEDARDRADGAG
jgi:hypothetical protein